VKRGRELSQGDALLDAILTSIGDQPGGVDAT
jgi:hypothetical protein